MTRELDKTERDMLAREIAADNHDWQSYAYDQVPRLSFCAGWEAAMVHMRLEAESADAFCWVCRTHHRLSADQCRAMDGIA